MRTDKIPPQALDVERTILGSMMTDSKAAAAVIGLLTEEAFYSSANGKIFSSMCDMSRKSIPIDIVTLSEELKKKSWLDSIGGEMYLGEIAESFVTAANVKHYAEIVLEKAALRQVILAASCAIENCYNPETQAETVVNELYTALRKCTGSSKTSDPKRVIELLPQVFEQIGNESQNPKRDVLTGLTDVDNAVIVKNGDLVIIAGRPSMGKSALSSQIARFNGISSKKSIAYFSLEMSNISEIQRGLFSEAGISLYDFNRGTLPRREFPKLSNAAGPYAESNIWIDDTPGITPLQIESKCNWIKTQTGLDLIVIDYLQLMRADGRHESRRHELEYISRELKLIAKRFSVPVIALSQLSRKVEERKPARPMLSDLRESGAIEQDADIVLFMYRPEYYEKTTDKKGITEIIIGKQRNGRTGYVEVFFDESSMRFKDLEKNMQDNHWTND